MGSPRDVIAKMYVSKDVDPDLFEELEEKNREISQLQLEKESILQQKKIEIEKLLSKIIQIQKDCEFELGKMKKRNKHNTKIFKKEKRKIQKENNLLQTRVIQLKIQTSDAIVTNDEIEMKYMKKVRLLTERINEYERMITEHNIMAKKNKNKGFFRSILNF